MLRVIGIKIGRKSAFHSKIKIFSLGKITIGSNSTIGSGCYLDNRRGIKIGNNVIISHDTKIYTLGHDIDDPFCRTKGKEVIIEDYSLIFSNVLIMPGVKIAKGAVVYPGSVVVNDIPPYAVAGGNPVRIIRKRTEDLQYKVEYKYWFAL